MNSNAQPAIDLRSDSFTLPTPGMWDAMRAAELGWASAGEDRNISALEERLAALASKEAGLFTLTGTMANLTAILTHTERGDQILLEASSHILWCEEWGLCHLAGLLPRPIRGNQGTISADSVVEAVEESLYRHVPRSTLLCLENTDNVFGAALPLEDTRAVANAAHERGLSVHLDGARVFNAQVALGVPLAELLAPVDSALIGLGKGLGVPGGAALVGSAEFIQRARVNLRRLGGASYHHAGIQGAAALYALDTLIQELSEDHRRAQLLATTLSALPGITIRSTGRDTNIVLVELEPSLGTANAFVDSLASRGVRCYLSSPTTVRFVTSRQVSDSDVLAAAATVSELIAGQMPCTD